MHYQNPVLAATFFREQFGYFYEIGGRENVYIFTLKSSSAAGEFLETP